MGQAKLANDELTLSFSTQYFHLTSKCSRNGSKQ